MKPHFRLLADGKDITPMIAPRLVRLSYFDNPGGKSDQLEIVLDDKPNIEFPKKGSRLSLALGSKEVLTEIGSFVVSHQALRGPPQVLKITATALELAESLKSMKERSWEDLSLKSLIEEIARLNQLKAAVSHDFDGVRIEHEDQTESDMAFLTRLASRYDAIFKPIDSHLVFVKRGEGLAASGESYPKVIIRTPLSYEYSASSSEHYTGVRAFWWDKGHAAMNSVLVGRDGVVYELRFLEKDMTAARARAEASFKDMARGQAFLSFEAAANLELFSERLCQIEGIREGVDGRWLIQNVEHSIDASGFISRVNCVGTGDYEETSL